MSSNPTIYRKDYLAPQTTIERIEMRVDIQKDFTDVSADLTFHQTREADAIELDGEALEILSLSVDGQTIDPSQYDYDGKKLTVRGLPAAGTLSSIVRIYPDDNKALEGFYRSGGMLTTQCEAEGFRRITFFVDRPDVLSLYKVRLEANKTEYPTLLSNGNCIAEGDLADGRHFAEWEDPIPKPCYIFAMAAGELSVIRDTFTTMSGREVALAIFTEPKNADKTAFSMEALKRSMRWDETRFGLEYDLDIFMIVAVDHFNMGAMENKGLNIFNSRYVLANTATATDAEYRRIEGIIGHEYFHNWTGNRITCRSWFELSLKEGLTVFRDQEFSADMGARDIQRIEDVSRLLSVQFPEDSSPMAHPVRPDEYQEINNFYTPTVYEKGAEVVRLLHTRLGEEGFQKGMRLYTERHDGQAVTCDDFVAAMADANDIDLSNYLGWYRQAGTPHLTASTSYDATQQQLTIALSQKTPATPGQDNKSPVPIPVNFALFAADGQPLSFSIGGETHHEGQLMLDIESASWTLEHVSEAPVVSLLRNFSAPVKLKYGQSLEERALLLAHESDAYSRWAASQAIFESLILDAHAANTALDGEKLSQVIAALETLLAQQNDSPELISTILSVPSYAMLMDRTDRVDIDSLTNLRSTLIRHIAEALNAQFAKTYAAQKAADQGRYEDAPVRALKNTALQFWAAADQAGIEAALAQIAEAKNMTDELSGVQAIIVSQQLTPSVEKQVLVDTQLAAFHDRWSSDGQVIEKWLELSSQSFTETDGLAQLDALMAHTDFDAVNPNHIRGAIGGFIRNLSLFHRADGKGYQRIAAEIAKLDSQNPQMGAGLCRAFSTWGKLDDARQTLVKAELEQLQQSVRSANVREWVEKLLER